MKNKILKIMVFIVLIFALNISESRGNEIIEMNQSAEGNIIHGQIKQHVSREECQYDSNEIKFGTTFNPDILLGEPTLDSSKKYYYNQITSDIGQKTYTGMINDTEGVGAASIDISSYKYILDNATMEDAEICFGDKIAPYTLDGVIAFIQDNPERYWYFYDFDIKYDFDIDTTTKEIHFIKMDIISKINEINNKTEFDNKLNNVAAEINESNMYDELKEIHDYICKNVKYEVIDDTSIEQTAYGALMLNKAVCEGQAGLFGSLCRKKGIICITVFGFTAPTNGIAHAWNYVYHPETKKWYAVDVTWDNYSDGSVGNYNYFMVGSNTKNDSINFIDNHIPGLKNYYIQTYIPNVPTLSVTEYKPFRITVSKSNYSITNQDIIVTIQSDKELEEQEGWTLSTDKKSMTKKYTESKKEYITIRNTEGGEATIEIDVTNIDKNPPSVLGITNNSVVTEKVKPIITDENNITITLIKDNQEITYTPGEYIIENGTYELIVEDEAGNITIVNFIIQKTYKDDTVTSNTYNVDNDKIMRVKPETRVTDFKNNIYCESSYVVKDVNGNTMSDNSYIGTCCKVITETGREYTVVVLADSDGNGKIDLVDVGKSSKIYLGTIQADEIDRLVYDLDGNGKVDLVEVGKLPKVYLRLLNI